MSSRPLGWYIDFYNKTLAPHVCLWSPHVVPRRPEWNDALTVGGYAFSVQCHEYIPSWELQHFLAAEQPFIAISFGSMRVNDPGRFLSILSQALANVGAKAVLTRSWNKGDSSTQGGELMYIVDDIPHEWLLPRVQGFVHHGGAGHTAAGLRAGVPALILPFCLDQNFWAAQAHSLGTGTPPIPFKEVTVHSLTNGLSDLLSGKYRERGAQIAAKISLDPNGAQIAAEHVALQMKSAKTVESCCMLPGLKSQWRHADSRLPLSGVAVVSLVSQGLLSWSDVEYLPAHEWADPTAETTRQARLLVSFMSLVGSFVQFVYGLLVGSASVEKRTATNPVHEARVRQSLYDLDLIKGQSENTFQGNDLDRRLAQNWETLRAREFHRNFERSACPQIEWVDQHHDISMRCHDVPCL